jgi:hypothetical protein
MAVTPPARPAIPLADNRPKDGLAREGLRVKIEPIPGVTKKGLIPRDGFYFQCPPLEEFGTDYAHSHTDYDTPTKGQFSRKGGRTLRTVSFDTLVVDQGSFTILGRDVEIEEFCDRLVKICERGDPFIFTVAHQMPPRGYASWGRTLAGPEIQMEATLRTVRISEKAGEGDARYIGLSVVEYREPFVSQRKLGEAAGEDSKGRDWPKVVLLKRDGRAEDKDTGIALGDHPLQPLTLALLAKKFYSEPKWWAFIAEYRKNRINNWGPNDQLVQYFDEQRRTKDWPVKIHVPKPPDGEFEWEFSD